MPRKKAKLSTRPYFTEAEYGMLQTICPTGEPTLEQIACLYRLFKSLHTPEEIHREYTNFREQDKEWSARCAKDKARGPTNLDVANRTFQSPNITPLFTFTVEDTKDLYEAGMRLLERSQKGKGNQLPSNNTSVHRHAFCELINFEKTKAGKAFQKLLDKHKFQSRIVEALEALWKSKATDRRTARGLGRRHRGSGRLLELGWYLLGIVRGGRTRSATLRRYPQRHSGLGEWGLCTWSRIEPSDDSPRDIQHFRLPRCSCRPDAFGSVPSSISVEVAGVSCCTYEQYSG